MKKLIRYWNQNRLKIIIIGIIIVFIIILIQTINHLLENSRNEMAPQTGTIPDMSRPTESVISGGKIPEENVETNSNIIKQFVDYCNNKQYQDAYNLLSDECKEEVYPSLELFTENYVNNIFDTQKTYTLELWFSTSYEFTYRILYINDNILATGNVNLDGNKEDYITVVEEEDQYKLNINNFIYKEMINKTVNASNLEITVNDSCKYRSYETYTVTVNNTSDKTILLSAGNNGNDICIIDENDVEYDSIISEISLINLEVAPGEQKTIEIRFYKIYNLYRTIERMEFKNIILDKESYEVDINNVNTTSITIDI